MRPTPGDTICGRVRIEAEMALGLGAAVFGAGQTAILTDTERAVWLTVVERTLVPSQADLSRFMAGANGLSDLAHESLVSVALVDREADFCVIGFDPPPRATGLADLAEEHRSPDLVANVAVQTARALAFLHAGGRLHGALEEGSVVLTEGRIQLLQYGLTELCDPTRLLAQLRRPGASPIAPELVAGEALAPSADVFAWGALVAELTTGHEGADAVSAVLMEDVAMSPLLRCAKAALSSDPATRPQTGRAVLGLLANAEVDPTDPASVAFAPVRELAARYLAESTTPAARVDASPAAPRQKPGPSSPEREARRKRSKSRRAEAGAAASPSPPELAPRRGEMVASDDPDPDPFSVAVVPRSSPRASGDAEAAPEAPQAPSTEAPEGLHLPQLHGTQPAVVPPQPELELELEFEPEPELEPEPPRPPTTPARPSATERAPAKPPVLAAASEPSATPGATAFARVVPRPAALPEPAAPTGVPLPSVSPSQTGSGPQRRGRMELDVTGSAGVASGPMASHPVSGTGFTTSSGSYRGSAGGPPPRAALGPTGASMAALIALVSTLLAVGLTVPVAGARGGLAAFLGLADAPAMEPSAAQGDTDVAEEPGAEDPDSSATPLGCPPEMVQLGTVAKDGTASCIEVGESPGLREVPHVNVSLAQAKAACAESAKRLCSGPEWRRACKGAKGTRFPYGNTRQRDRCNDVTGGVGQNLSRSGARERCVTPSGVYDLVGNVGEWVEDGSVLGGDAMSRAPHCGTKAKPAAGAAGPSTGFRCCVTAQIEPSKP